MGNPAPEWMICFSLIFRKVLPSVRFRSVPFYALARSVAAFLPSRPLLYPYFMQIEPTTRCDLLCRFCPRESIPVRRGDISLNAFRIIVDRNPFAVAILLQGLGEPLLHAEIEEMIRYGRSKGIFMGICTNGMHLTPGRFERLIGNGLNYLAISVDGTGEAFDAMRGGFRFDLLVEHLSGIRKRNRRNCLLAFWMRLSQQNLDQVPAVLDLARDFGIEHVHFQDLQYKQDPEALCRLSLSSSPDGNGKRAFLASERRHAAQHRIMSTFDPVDRHQNRTRCMWPWEGIYVDCRGDILPCCVAWEQGFTMGNLLESGLSEIWKGSHYKQFRLALREGPLPRICGECRFL